MNFLNTLTNTMINENKTFNAAFCDYFLVNDEENFIKRVDAAKNPIGCGIIFKTDDLRRIEMYSKNKKIMNKNFYL